MRNIVKPQPPKNPYQAALARQTERNRVLQKEKAEAEAREVRTRQEAARDKNEFIARERARDAGLNENDQKFRVFVDKVMRRYDAHVGAARPGLFDVYRACNEVRAEVLGTLGPPREANPIEMALSPARGDAGALPPSIASDRLQGVASREQQARAVAAERGQRLIERDRHDREAYQAALRKHGLTDPSIGFVDNGGGDGLARPR